MHQPVEEQDHATRSAEVIGTSTYREAFDPSDEEVQELVNVLRNRAYLQSMYRDRGQQQE